MESVLQSTISALGCLDDGVYCPEPDCFESVRDLIRFLRYDTATVQARRICGERNIIQNDLVPIMKADATPDNLFDIALRLAINLTQPTAIAFNGKSPEDKECWSAYLEVEENLKRSKVAFADEYFFRVLKDKLEGFFQKDWSERTEEAKMVVERIFVLIRNALSIASISVDLQRTAWNMDTQDRVVLALLKSGLGNYVVDVAASEADFRLIILEILAHIVKKREPRHLAYADRGRSIDEKKKDEEELKKAVSLSIQKQVETRRNLNVRHSRFAGSYVIKGVKAVNQENDLVVQKALKDVTHLDYLNDRKVAKRKAKNRRAFEYNEKKQVSTLEVRVELKNFCIYVLQKAYNAIMRHCKDAAFGGRRTLVYKYADIHYFLLEWFFMEFRRLCLLPTTLVSSTLGKDSFHHLQIQLDTYLESMEIERKEGRVFGLKAQYAVLAYKELLSSLWAMIESGSTDEKEEAMTACKLIMEMPEYRDLSTSIIRRYKPGVLSKNFLRILVTATHIYVRLLEKNAKSGQLSKIKKRRKIRRRKKKAEQVTEDEENEEHEASNIDVDAIWESVSEELSDVVFGYIEPSEDVNPIDVLLLVEDDVHERFAMLMIQRALREHRVTDAVGLYRASRLLWPSGGGFGTDGMPTEEEFLELHAIFFADLSEIKREWKVAYEAAYGKEAGQTDENIFDAEMQGSDAGSADESEDDEARYEETEVDFDFSDYIVKFARKDVLKWYVFLLAEFETNSVELNRAILKLFHRVAFDLGMSARLYQISLFRIFSRVGNIFQRIPLADIKKSPFFEIYEFGFHLLKTFFKTYGRIGWKLIPETFFWKGRKEVYEIECGYGSYVEAKTKEKEHVWTEELDTEIRTLHDEYLSCEDKPEGLDVVEFIEHNLSAQRTRKQIVREMRSLGLDTLGAKTRKGMASGSRKSTMFLPDLLEQMRILASEFDATSAEERTCDKVDFIRSRLPQEFSRPRIIKQLKYEGIGYAAERRKPSKPWPEELQTELRSICEQYKELEHTSGDLVGYAALRLSSKKPRKEIATKLRELGLADVQQQTTRIKKSLVESIAGHESDSFDDEENDDIGNLEDIASSSAKQRLSSPALSEEYLDSDDGGADDLVKAAKPSVMARRFSDSFDIDSDNEDAENRAEENLITTVKLSSIEEDKSRDVESKTASFVLDLERRKEQDEVVLDFVDDEDDLILLRRNKRSVETVDADENEAEELPGPAPKKRVVLSDSDDE